MADYISALRGPDHENARRRLIEMGPQVISLITTQFQRERDASLRATLVNVASQTNSSTAIPFLTEALDDVEPNVWKEALDGLVSLGGLDALEVIRQARRRAPEKAEWLDEAIAQITANR